MKKWEIELMNIMSKSNVDSMQKDVNTFINNLLKEINTGNESGLILPEQNEDEQKQWYRMGKNRTILDLSEYLKKQYIKD